MIKHVDMFGAGVLPGDYVAFAQRDGNSQKMAIAVVLKLDIENPKSAKLWSGSMDWRWDHETETRNTYFRPNSKQTTTARLDECIVLPMDSISFAVREAMVEAGVGHYFNKEAKKV